MKSSGKVAIIIPNYNGERVLFDCISSILKSTYQDYAIIIVDDHSAHFAASRLTGIDSRIICIQNEENLGFSASINKGIEYAVEHDFDYVMPLNNDTLIDNHMLSILVTASARKYVTVPTMYYAAHRDVIWYGGGKIDPRSGRVIHTGRNKKSVGQTFIKEVTFATGCCLLIPASIIKEIGMLDTAYYMYYEDVEYSARITVNRYKILYVSNALLWHRVNFTTSKVGGNSLYYTKRNWLYFIKTSSYIADKRGAYLYVLRDSFRELCSREHSLKYKQTLICAWADFLCGKTGKTKNF